MIDSDDNADDESEGLLMSNILVNTIKTTFIKIRNGSQSTKGTAQTNRLFHSLQRTNVFAIPQSPDFTEVF